MGGFGAAAVVLGVLTGAADAGPFTHKASQGEWVVDAVERPLVMPKGWLEVGVSADTKHSSQYRGGDGKLRAYDEEIGWRYSRLWFELRQGFSDRITLYGRVPIVDARLDLAMGSQVSTTNVGDARLGVVVQPWLDGPGDLGFSIELKTPTGVEWPEGGGGPDDTSGFLTGTGTTDMAVNIHGRWTLLERLQLGADAGYVHKFAAIVGYVEEVGGFGNGVIDPGDEVRLSSSVMGKIIDGVSITVDGRYRRMGEAQIGVSGDGERILRPIKPSGGGWFDARMTLSVEPSPHWLIEGWTSRDLAGGDTRAFAHLGLEDLSPQPGWTFGSRVAVRW